MQGHNRRVFMLHAVAGTTALASSSAARAEPATEPVKETDPYPKSMGFKLNTSAVDQAKFPRHDISQKCSECQLFSAPSGSDKLGTCSFFKRLVPPDGWCRNFKPRKAA